MRIGIQQAMTTFSELGIGKSKFYLGNEREETRVRTEIKSIQ